MSGYGPRAKVWDGQPSGPRFAGLLHDRAEAAGLRLAFRLKGFDTGKRFGFHCYVTRVDQPAGELLVDTYDDSGNVRVFGAYGEALAVGDALAAVLTRLQTTG